MSSSPAIGSDGTVYVGSWDNSIYGLNSTGSLLWSYQTGRYVSSSPAIGSDGRVYVGSYDHRLYVFYDPTSTPTPVPTAVIELNGTSFKAGERLVATFRVNAPIERLFTVYAVLVMPKGKMLNARTLDRPLKPVAKKVRRLPAGFTYQIISKTIPRGAPKGEYELVAAFFDPGKPIHGRQDAFLDVSAKFTIQ